MKRAARALATSAAVLTVLAVVPASAADLHVEGGTSQQVVVDVDDLSFVPEDIHDRRRAPAVGPVARAAPADR